MARPRAGHLSPPRSSPPAADPPQGLAPRALAAGILAHVLSARTALDETLERRLAEAGLDARDGGLVRAIAVTSFRRYGTIGHALDARLERGWHSVPEAVRAILVTAAAQVLFLDTPNHAAIDCAVALAKAEAPTERFSGLVNAVLRRISVEAEAILDAADPFEADTPRWLRAAWSEAYGEPAARRIAAAHREEPALDLSVKADAGLWAERLDALLLPTGSLRLRSRTAVTALPGYDEGAWWVQDAASAQAARLLDARPGERVLDMCAAPGGKSAQLAAAGARVTALDRSAPRMARLRRNLERLGLAVETVVADAAGHAAEPYDAVLLDAPCSATGTIRRHPDVAWTKRPEDLAKLAALQARLLDRAADLTRPGGRLVYCTCSLEPAEGEEQVAALLARRPDLRLDPIAPAEVPVEGAVTPAGHFRALPFQLPGETPRLSGWAGFFAARLVRS